MKAKVKQSYVNLDALAPGQVAVLLSLFKVYMAATKAIEFRGEPGGGSAFQLLIAAVEELDGFAR